MSPIQISKIGLAALLILLAAALRAPQIDGDPPAGDVSRSGDFLADEGIQATNALQWALTGEWYIPQAFNPAVNTPVFTLYEFGLMKAFGVSLATVRYGAIVCGVLSLALFYFLLTRFDRRAAWFALGLGAIHFPLLIYNRLALIENLLLIFCVALALILIAVARRPSDPKWVVAFWLVFALAYLTKPIVLFFIPLFFAVAWQADSKARKKILGISLLTAAGLAAAVWILWISRFSDDWSYYQRVNLSERMDLNPIALAKNYARYFSHLKLFEFMPVLYTLALLMTARGLYFFRGKETPLVERILILWLALGWLQFAFLAYSPPRFAVMLIPPILGLNGLFFSEMFGRDRSQSKSWPGVALVAVLIVCVAQIAFGFYRVKNGQMYPSCFLALIAPAAVLALWLFSKQKLNRATVGWSLLALIAAVQSFQIFRFHLNMEFSLRHALRETAAVLQQEDPPAKKVIAGDLAHMVAFEARAPFVDTGCRPERLPQRLNTARPNYLILEDGDAGLARLKEGMPGYWQNVKPLKRFTILNNYRSGRDAVLYILEE